MRIAVDARFLQAANEPDLREFTKEVFVRLWCKYSKHHFVLFTNNAFESNFTLPENVSVVVLTPKPTNLLLYKWWYDISLALALKKHKADVFVATYGCGSLTSSVHQVLVVRDLVFLKRGISLHGHHNNFRKKYTAKFIKKAKAIATLSNSAQEELRARYDIKNTLLETIGSGISAHFHKAEWQEKEIIKEQFSEGFEYFVFSLNAYSQVNFLSVLKAFSIFKKWQKSNMKLLVIGEFDKSFEKEIDKLKSYKFKEEVLLKKEIVDSETGAIVAAAYAFIFLSSAEGFPQRILEAMASGAPVITSHNSTTMEVAGDAALYADPSDPTQIAEQMKKIYKDEQLKNKLADEGILKSKQYNWDSTSALLWQVIQQVHSQ